MPDNSLPLYDSLIKECKSKPLTVKHKKYITSKIEKLNEHKRELVYVLIEHYSSIKNKQDLFYQKVNNKDKTSDVSYDLDKLPNVLGQIILKFLEKDEQVCNEHTF